MKGKRLFIIAVLSLGFLLTIVHFSKDPRTSLLFLKLTLKNERNHLRAQNHPYKEKLKHFSEEISQREKSGQPVECSYQIYRELRWLVEFSEDESAIRARLSALEASFNNKTSKNTDAQSPDDGSYGGCYSEWFMRTWQTAERIQDVEDAAVKPKYPFHFLDRVNSPEKLSDYFSSVFTTDFKMRQEFTRVRADDSLSGLGRLILRGRPSEYAYHPELKEAYARFLDQWQDPDTGMWGVRYKIGPLLISTPDTGVTFHVLSQRKCEVQHLDQIAETMLKLENLDFPFGWKINGHNENHMNWDAVRIFRCAWPKMSKQTQEKVREQTQAMLNWSLHASLTTEGLFKTSELDDTVGDAVENGVNFLDEVGYFDKQKRFWTTQEFPESHGVFLKLKAQILAIGLTDPHIKNARDHLNQIQTELK